MGQGWGLSEELCYTSPEKAAPVMGYFALAWLLRINVKVWNPAACMNFVQAAALGDWGFDFLLCPIGGEFE